MKIGYMRVSSTGDRQSTSMQKEALLRAGVDESHIFEDNASALSSKRPGLEKALALLRAGDELVVWKLDRMARNLSHLIAIANKLQEGNMGLVSLTEKLDTSTPHGQLFFHMFGALAEFELSLIRERILEGIEAAKNRGSRLGRPRAISPEKMAIVLEHIQQGKSKASICRTLDIKEATLFDALRRDSVEKVSAQDKMNAEKTPHSSTEGVSAHE
jgi:DNA invertase Pin-like site-specific DNA recombinase